MPQKSQVPKSAIRTLIEILNDETIENPITDELKYWSAKNGLTVLSIINGVCILSTPNIRKIASAFSDVPLQEATVLLLSDQPPNVLDLMELMGRPTRFLVPIVSAKTLKLKTLTKSILNKGPGDVIDSIFDSHGMLFIDSERNLLDLINCNPFQFLTEQSLQNCDVTIWGLMKTPSLFQQLTQGLTTKSEKTTWAQLLGSLPLEARQSIGVLLIRKGFLRTVEELKLVEINSFPEKIKIGLLCEGFMENYLAKRTVSDYREYLRETKFPFEQIQRFDVPRGITVEDADFIALTGVAQLGLNESDSDNLTLSSIVRDWTSHILRLEISPATQQHILFTFLIYLNHYKIATLDELLDQISWNRLNLNILKRPSVNYYLEFLRAHPEQFKALFVHPQDNQKSAVPDRLFHLEMIRIAVKHDLDELKNRIVVDLTSNTLPKTPSNCLVAGRILIRAHEFSAAISYYCSLPSEVWDEKILRNLLESYYCTYQFEQVRVLLDEARTSKISVESRIMFQIKILIMEGRLEDAKCLAIRHLDELKSSESSFDLSFELGRIYSLMMSYELAHKQFDALVMVGLDRHKYEMVDFEKQLLTWYSGKREISTAHVTANEKLKLKNLVSKALISSDPEVLAQDCFANYISWDFPFHSYQHWFLLCAIALSMKADRLDLSQKYLKAWKQDPWISGKQQAKPTGFSYEHKNSRKLDFWKQLVTTCFPDTTSANQLAKLLLKIRDSRA